MQNEITETLRETERRLRSEGHSRTAAAKLAADLIKTRKGNISMRYSKIRNEIGILENAIASIRSLAEREGRQLDADEREDVKNYEAKVGDLRMELPVGGPLTLQDGPLGGQGDGRTIDVTDGVQSIVPKGRDYCSMFNIPRAQLRRDGFKNFNDYLTVFSSGKYDERLNIRAVASETVPSDGGFSTMPEMFAAWLLDASLESEIVRPRAQVWPMKSDSLKVPGWDAATHSSSLFGGLTGTWLAELGTATEVFAKMRQIQLNAKKLACYTAASNELVADGVDYERQIQQALVKTIGWYLDYAFLSGGTGAGMPLSVLNDPALVTVNPEAGQTDGIIFENATKMYARIAPQCMGNAVWIASQTAVPSLLTMSLAVGTGGSMIQPAVLQQGGKFSLLGKEVIFTEKVPALGTKGDFMLVDLSQYTIGLRKEVSLDKSIHVGWSQDIASYRAILRADGQGMWDKAITPKAGDSLSWCVALGAR